MSPALAGGFSTIEPPGKPDNFNINDKKENKEGKIALMTEFLVCTFFVCVVAHSASNNQGAPVRLYREGKKDKN